MSSDLVVVTFSKDLELCKLFIRSVDLFVDPTIFNNLWIIITDDSEFDFTGRYKWNIVRSKDVFELSTADNFGYINQQRSKLEISNLINSDWYWVFDSKNFFVRSITPNDLYNNDRAIVNVTHASNDWFKSWGNSLKYFQLSYTDPIHNRCPYPIRTKLAQSLDKAIFEQLWLDENICEFFWYNAWVLKNNQFDKYYYKDDKIFNTTLWPIDLDREIYRPVNLRTALKNLKFTQMPVWTAGLHRTTIQMMNIEQQAEWATFLTELGLFDSEDRVYEWYDAVRLVLQKK
jgi:hypothetical protein